MQEAEKMALPKEIQELKIEAELNKQKVASLEEKVERLKEEMERLEQNREQQKKLREQSILADLRQGIYQYFLYSNRHDKLIRPFVIQLLTTEGPQVFGFRMRMFFAELNGSDTIKRLIMEFYNVDNLDFLDNVRGLVQDLYQANHLLESIKEYEFNMAEFLKDAQEKINEMKFFKAQATSMLEQARTVIKKTNFD